MPKICEAPECTNLVNEKGFAHRKLLDKLFCCTVCERRWLAGRGISVVGDPPRLPILRVPITGG